MCSICVIVMGVLNDEAAGGLWYRLVVSAWLVNLQRAMMKYYGDTMG